MEKRKTWAIVLLVIIYMSIAGNYLGNEATNENAMLLALVDIAIYSFVLMIVPLCFRIKNKELLSYKKGKRICTYNSWIFFGISILLTIIFDTMVGIGGLGALFYYYINMTFFTYPKDYKKENEEDKKENYSLSFENEKVEKDPSLIYEEDINLQKTVEEKQLENLIDKLEEEKATEVKEETKVETVKTVKENKTILYVIIGVLAVALIGVGICAFSMRSTYKNKIKDLEYSMKVLENENDRLWKENTEGIADKIINSAKAEFLDENIVFVIDGYGNYYYTYEQMKTVTQGIGEYSYWEYNKEQAISRGYKAWK